MLNAINRYLLETRAIQEATYPLERLIYCEDICIQGAIDTAQRRLKTKYLLNQAARNQQEKLMSLLRQQGLAASKPEWQPLPVFSPLHHPNPEITAAITERLQEMKAERDRFLRRIKAKLDCSPELKHAVIDYMNEIGAGHYLLALR